jgi:hypothetical protein
MAKSSRGRRKRGRRRKCTGIEENRKKKKEIKRNRR